LSSSLMKSVHLRSFSYLLPLGICCAVSFTGCAKKKGGVLRPARIGSSETGIASWYGHPYHGRRAANGEVYDMERFTAAHRTLPFGTWVRVKNLDNSKTVDLRIQDRGPFIDKRIIDLSRAGAREIGMLGPGIVKVRLTIIAADKVRSEYASRRPVTPVPEAPPAPLREIFGVQVGAFQDRALAETLRKRMLDDHGAARITLRPGDPAIWRVIAGEKETAEEARALAEEIRLAGMSAFAVRIDE